VLREQKAGREKLFINPGLMDLLKQPDNDFAPFQDQEKPEENRKITI